MAFEDKTPAYRLWHRRYLFMVPRAFIYGQKYLDRVGAVSSGDPVLDIQRQSVTEPMWKSVAAMALLHDSGAPIALVDKNNAPLIFRDIQDHLTNWEHAVNGGVYYKEIPPLEEFRALETVAIAMYPTVMRLKPSEQKEPQIARRLLDLRNQRNGGRMSRIDPVKEEFPPYRSIVDNIEQMLAEGSLWL